MSHKLFTSLMALLVWASPTLGAFGQAAKAPAPAGDESSAVKIDLVTVEELKSMLAKSQPVMIIDVRSSETYADSDNQIKGSIHFRLRKLSSRVKFPPLKDLPRDSEVVTYCTCENDKASIRAAQILIGEGFKRVRALKGGWTAWVSAKGPIERRLKT